MSRKGSILGVWEAWVHAPSHPRLGKLRRIWGGGVVHACRLLALPVLHPTPPTTSTTTAAIT
jgi:hypothetical protein